MGGSPNTTEGGQVYTTQPRMVRRSKMGSVGFRMMGKGGKGGGTVRASRFRCCPSGRAAFDQKAKGYLIYGKMVRSRVVGCRTGDDRLNRYVCTITFHSACNSLSFERPGSVSLGNVRGTCSFLSGG